VAYLIILFSVFALFYLPKYIENHIKKLLEALLEPQKIIGVVFIQSACTK